MSSGVRYRCCQARGGTTDEKYTYDFDRLKMVLQGLGRRVIIVCVEHHEKENHRLEERRREQTVE